MSISFEVTPLSGAGRTQYTQLRVRGTSATLPRPLRRCERFLAVDLEMAPLQPRHEDPRKARRTSVRIALAPKDMGASGQVPRIGSRQQPRERINTRRIEGLPHSRLLWRYSSRQAVISSRPVQWFTPALLQKDGNLPSEMTQGSLHVVPVRVLLLPYNVLILMFGRFPSGQVHCMNVKGSDVIPANERRRE
jgi:hypothetical protein